MRDARRLLQEIGGPILRPLARSMAREQAALEQTAPDLKVALRQLYLGYARQREAASRPLTSGEVGFRIFSQFDEDGIVLWLLGTIGIGPMRFVDIGAGDGVHASNCANLALNLGFHGLFVEANPQLVERGREFYRRHPDTAFYPPVFVQAFVTRANVTDIVRSTGFEGDVDLLSIDIDGNDFWIWEAIECISPRIVVIEAHPELGTGDVVVPYSEDLSWSPGEHAHYLGASLLALARLGQRLGYRLVGANRFGFNLFFVRDELAAELLPEIDVEELFRHPRNQERVAMFESIKHLEFAHAE